MADPNDTQSRPEDALTEADNQAPEAGMAEPEPPVFSDDAPGFDMLNEADAANEAISEAASEATNEAVDAPVAILRVYCSWPGVSATIKCLFSVEKKR